MNDSNIRRVEDQTVLQILKLRRRAVDILQKSDPVLLKRIAKILGVPIPRNLENSSDVDLMEKWEEYKSEIRNPKIK